MGAAAGAGGAVEVEGGVAGLRGMAGARRGLVVAEGVRPPQALETPRGNTDDLSLVLAYYLPGGLAVRRAVPGGGS